MQGSDEWRVNNINGRQGVHAKPPYPGIGRCSAKLYQCPLPVSTNQVSMTPVVAPGRDAALMEFEESSIDFLSPQLPADFSTVRWNTPLGEVIVPGSALGDGNEDEVKPSQAEVRDIVPPLVVWEELFNASEAYFTDGSDGGDDVGVSMVEVEGLQEGGEADAGERDSAGEDVVGDAIAEFAYWVVLAGGGCVVVLGVFAVLSIVFGWRGA